MNQASPQGPEQASLGRALEEVAHRGGGKPPSKRRYREYEWVVLNSPIKCPKRGVTADNFPGEHFAFFVEDGFFCIEARATGIVVDVDTAQIREARRHKPKVEEP